MEVKTTQSLEKYQAVRKRTEEICRPLKREDYVPQPVVYISPPKWHLAHTTWFFEQFILKNGFNGYKEFDPDFGFLFNSYYNNVGERVFRAERGNLTRPELEEVLAYREYVDSHILDFFSSDSVDKEYHKLLELGLNHEEQHQELLITDLKFILGHNPIFPLYRQGGSLLSDKVNDKSWIDFDEEIFEVGYQGANFCFDNELNPHRVLVNPFSIRKELVSNGEYLEFIESGGYKDFNLWLDEGWAWVNQEMINSPMYWHHINGDWKIFTLGGLLDLDPNAILSHISYYEANAFANWKGLRLPSEYEWELASDLLNWGKRWEWTQSAYLPYPGFKKAEGAVGEYNGKFMVNQMVLRGSSVATSPGHSRKTYRNFFHPHLQWQYSGIRLVK